MKKLTAVAIVCAVMVGYSTVWAEMVSIGMGQMAQSEFLTLKAMVQGKTINGEATVSIPVEPAVRYGWVEMAPADFQALRDRVAGRADGREQDAEATPALKMVRIGTGEMPEDEFLALKRTVQDNGGLLCKHLALFQR
jgi:hypothetical protein